MLENRLSFEIALVLRLKLIFLALFMHLPVNTDGVMLLHQQQTAMGPEASITVGACSLVFDQINVSAICISISKAVNMGLLEITAFQAHVFVCLAPCQQLSFMVILDGKEKASPNLGIMTTGPQNHNN